MVLLLSEPTVQSYIVYSAILALKMMFMSLLTGAARAARGVVANPEDAMTSKAKIKFDDDLVERRRRAHRNDMENIPAFWVVAALYLTTGPAAGFATLLFRVFTLGRIVHTIVYAVVPMPQPSRAIAFGIPFVINIYMAVQVVLYYLTAL